MVRTACVAVVMSTGESHGIPLEAQRVGLVPADLHALKSVVDVQVSPDGSRIAYSVQCSDRPGRPYSQVWILDVAAGTTARLGSDRQATSGPRWSPDGHWIACIRDDKDNGALVVSRPDGSETSVLAFLRSTNHPLPSSGERISWAPDSRRIAYISSTPGPETEDANGDPMVITRYLYKPTASEGLTRFNDNQRLHIFIADISSRLMRQLTGGDYYEHSIDWSPSSDEIVFVSNREPDPDRFFNYDLFAVAVADGNIRRLTSTKNAEYSPVWSPDGKSIAYLGTTRDLTSSETTMEDTHVWVMDASGSNRREIGTLDSRQGPPRWAPDGRTVLATVQERGTVGLYRFRLDGTSPTVEVHGLAERARVGAWSAGGGVLAYALETPAAPAELYVRRAGEPPRQVTNLNPELRGTKAIADVEALVYKSFDGTDVEAFLTKPLRIDPARRHPLIAMIKGGPHNQIGPVLNTKAQVYAARGFAVLMVNYRGSTGYGQKFADAIFGDQNGGEAMDVMAGVDAAIARYSWIDPDRLGVEGGSYGGQLTNWLITQTDRFKAAVSAAGIANLISFNYLAYYHDYLAVEFGLFPHQTWPAGTKPAAAGDAMHLMDLLWTRSPLRYVARVKTPTMFVHGENDNDVPIAEAEQFYIALRDAGVETIMVRYPREGHGVPETKHQVDIIERSLSWYEEHFAGTGRRVRPQSG